MSIAKTYSAQPALLSAHIVTIEVDLARGLHAFSIVGLPDKAVEESSDRVASAIKNSGFESPKSKNQKVVIALAPADIKKEGPLFDLPIALAYLSASGDIHFASEKKLFVGELALDGTIRPVHGVLPLIIEAQRQGFSEAFVPHENAAEAALVDGITIYGTSSLTEIIQHLTSKDSSYHIHTTPRTEVSFTTSPHTSVDMEDIRGQESAKRGLEIAAAGGHNIALWGPPGTGKSMLAKALRGILPPLSFDDALEATAIHSVAGLLHEPLLTEAPFRSPHHTSSYVSLVGGGTIPKPGEVTLAHRGVLFLDEFPEFDRRVIEALRQPLEDRVVSVSRAKGSALFPAHFILIAAMNPCPCGKWGTRNECICSPSTLQKYQRKLSGPIVDRIDMWLEVGALDHRDLAEHGPRGEQSAPVRERVLTAREKQHERFVEHKDVRVNSEMGVRELPLFAPLAPEVEKTLADAATKMNLSARSYHRTIKLARTIADLDGADNISVPHMIEALHYRPRWLQHML